MAISRFRATRHPHIPGMWCYRQSDKAYAHLRVGLLDFAEGGSLVCAIADIVDVKPDKVLAFLQEEGYIIRASGAIAPEIAALGISDEGIAAAIDHFGGSVFPGGIVGFRAAVEACDLDALRMHLASGLPAIIYLDDSDGLANTAVAVAGYSAARAEILLFDPRAAERDGWYPWETVASKTKAYVLAKTPEDNRYTPRSIFKQIYGVDIAGREQRWPDIDLSVLQAINPGCVGWVHLGGTPISYPIVKDHFDATYYQTHNFSGEPSIHGVVCLSFANCGSLDAPNLVFSAHRMKDYSMFKMLTFFDRPSFSEENPYIDLLLGSHLYRARVFSAYHFPKRRDEAFRVDFADDADFEQWVSQRAELSMHPFAPLSGSGKVATFRTCYGMENDQTFALHAQLEEVSR